MSFLFSNCTSLTEAPNVADWDVSNVTTIFKMFVNCPVAPDVRNWDVSSLVDGTEFMRDCAPMTTAVYDEVLVNWEAIAPQSDVPIHFGTSKYTPDSEAAAARQRLIDRGWTITDGGPAE
jgi:surface protein